jgi:hypothetical protein
MAYAAGFTSNFSIDREAASHAARASPSRIADCALA